MTHWKAALRSVLRRPAFTLTAVAVLAFGIGANSALFSVVDTVLLKPLSYPHPDRLVRIMEGNTARNERESLVSPARLADWNRLSESFSVISGWYTENVTDTSQAQPQRLAGRRVAPRFFDVFAAPPLIGRTFSHEEERFDGPPAAVISEGVWTNRYHRDPGVLGRRLVLAGAGYTIVGVMPKEFAEPTAEVWLPARINPRLMQIRDARFFRGVGRMKPEVTIEQAKADLDRLCRRLAEQYPKTDAGWSALITDYKERMVGASSRALSLMFAATVLLLLILCANIAGLLLGQLQRRERELAVRGSLGATTSQITGVILREVAILAFLSGALGLVIASAGIRVLSRLFADLPRIQELQLDWRIALFTIAATAVTALVFGLVPAVQVSRRNLNSVLSQSGRGQTGRRRRLQQILVGAQFAVTLVLLAGAGLLLRSYENLTRVQPGFRAANVVTFHVGAEWSEDRNRIGLLQQQIITELQQLPGIEAAGITNFLPASSATLREQVSIEGLPHLGDDGKISTGTRMVSAGYLRALQLPLLQGTLCAEPLPLLDWKTPSKILVNKRFAEIAGGNVVGRQLIWSSGSRAEIIGVIGDVREDRLNSPAVPYVYQCTQGGSWPDPEYVVAVQGNPRQAVQSIRELLHRLAPQRAVFGVSTLAEHLDRTLDRPRMNAGLLGVFAVSALVSAGLGLYGLVMLTVTARTREIGIRTALGASPARIVARVIGESLRPLAVALAAGIAMALLVSQALKSVLFEVAPSDMLTFSCVCVLLIAVATAAALIPGRRAARIDPVEALRSE